MKRVRTHVTTPTIIDLGAKLFRTSHLPTTLNDYGRIPLMGTPQRSDHHCYDDPITSVLL